MPMVICQKKRRKIHEKVVPSSLVPLPSPHHADRDVGPASGPAVEVGGLEAHQRCDGPRLSEGIPWKEDEMSETTLFYILVDHVPVAEPDPIKWAEWMAGSVSEARDSLVAKDVIKGYTILTMFLGHNLLGDPHRIGCCRAYRLPHEIKPL